MNTQTQKLLPEFTNDDFSDEMYETETRHLRHLENSIPNHECGYPLDGSCDVCEAHTDNCSVCDAFLDAVMGFESLQGRPPYWADAIEQHRLIRIAGEVLEGTRG